MPSIRPVLSGLLLLGVLWGLMRVLLKRGMPHWWAIEAVQRTVRAVPWLGLMAVTSWFTGSWLSVRALSLAGATGVGVLVVVMLPMSLALIAASVVHRGGHWAMQRWVPGSPAVPSRALVETLPVDDGLAAAGVLQPLAGALEQEGTGRSTLEAVTLEASAGQEAAEEAMSVRLSPATAVIPARAVIPASTGISRRLFLEGAAAAFPAVALLSSTSGVVMAGQPRHMPLIELFYPDLPVELDGLKILHLSDVHLGVFVSVPDIERTLDAARAHAPDLIVLTGDVADDLKQLQPALQAVASLKPRLGAFAAIGNHEYFRGIKETRDIYSRSPVPLLLEAGHSITVGGKTLHLTGLADPIWLKGSHHAFLQKSLDVALNGAPSDAFHLVMSHRPEGLLAAAEKGLPLTLSGHTHGGQIGHGGRSVFEPLLPERYLWGHYQKGGSQLYTSAGFGHWFPFRLGCPAEAPILVLRRGSPTTHPA